MADTLQTEARIHAYRGSRALAAEYAKIGLENLGHATLVRPELEKILDANS